MVTFSDFFSFKYFTFFKYLIKMQKNNCPSNKTQTYTAFWWDTVSFLLLLLQITIHLVTTQICFLTVLERNLKWSLWTMIKVSAFLSEDSKAESVSWPFPASRGCMCSLAHACFSNNWITLTSALVVISPSLTLLPPSFTFKELCNYVGPTWMSQANLTISGSLI